MPKKTMTLDRYQPGLASRRARAMKVMQAIAEGKSLDQACTDLALQPTTFRKWLERDDFSLIVGAVMSEAAGAARIQIAEALPDMITRLTKLALAEETTPRNAMIAFKALVSLLQQLEPSKFHPVDLGNEEGKGDEPEEDDDTRPSVPFQPQFLGPTNVTITEEKQVVVDARALPERTKPSQT